MSANTIRQELDTIEEKRSRFTTRLEEIAEQLEENGRQRGRATAEERGEDANRLRTEARALEQEREDLQGALQHLETEAARLEDERSAAVRRETGERVAALTKAADAKVAAVRALAADFAAETFLPAVKEMEALLEELKRAGVAHDQATGSDNPYSGSGRAGSMLFTKYAPVAVIINDLRALVSDKPIARAPVVNDTPADAPQEAPLALR